MEELLKERIKANVRIFNKKEVETVLHNINIFAKIYLLGIVDVNQESL